MLIDDLLHMVCFMSQTVDIYVTNHKALFDMIPLLCRHWGSDMRGGGDGGHFCGLKGGPDGLRVELRLFIIVGDAVLSDLRQDPLDLSF